MSAGTFVIMDQVVHIPPRNASVKPEKLNYWDYLNKRYYIMKRMGKGTFSKVYMAYDSRHSLRSSPPFVAIKIVKPEHSDHEGKLELVALNDLDQTVYSPFRDRLIKLVEHFEHNGCRCFVFELSVCNLSSFTSGRRLPLGEVKSICNQILEGLLFLHGKCRRIHTDLKLENILVKSDLYTLSYMARKTFEKAKVAVVENKMLKEQLPSTLLAEIESVIVEEGRYFQGMENEVLRSSATECSSPETQIVIGDLGSSVICDRFRYNVIQTRFYRAPEVVVGMSYGKRVDMWSLGCVIFQLLTGNCLFYICDSVMDEEIDAKHLREIRKIIGPLPRHMRTETEKAKQIYAKNQELAKRDPGMGLYLESLVVKWAGYTQKESLEICSFLRTMLQVDPTYRCSAREAMNHPFLKGGATPSQVKAKSLQLKVEDSDDGNSY